MHKRVYKILVLIIIFFGAIFFMSKNIKEESIVFEKAVAMEDATFPLMYLKSNGYRVNRLHGYSGNIDANIVREAVTPVSQDKTLQIEFHEYETKIKKIKYELRALAKNTRLDSGDINILDKTESGREVTIKLDTPLNTSTEYAMKITVITEEGKKIYFYTRLKYYETDFFLKEKLDFVDNFHKKSMDKKKAEDLALYLETDGSEDGTSFARVSIHSDFERFSWGGLKPEVITEVVPVIKEITVETASIQLEYFVRIKTNSGTEDYRVREFYRIRYTSDRMYLLDYERTMESDFDVNLTSLTKSEFKIGITGSRDINLTTSDENGKIAFVRSGALWYYDLSKNALTQVFSFIGKKEDYLRAGYDQHNTRILNMDDNGNIDFTVYGYMNRGDYEGKVALILYHFSADSGLIKEMVCIPLETTYQMLKQDINDFSYVSQRGIFYFTIDNVVYSYNISAKKLTALVSDTGSSNFAVMEQGHGIAWTEKGDTEDSTKLVQMDLETEKKVEIDAPAGEIIRIFGNIQANVIYGYVRKEDITETADGTQIIPAYQLQIADVQGNILKAYEEKGIYITSVKSKGNIVRLLRAKKNGQGYKAITNESIISQEAAANQIIKLKPRTTDLMLTEYYLSLPDGFAMVNLPKMETTQNVILAEDTTLHLEIKGKSTEKYYVYAMGGIEAVFDNPAEAIILADGRMGVVVNQSNLIIWERGGKFNQKTIGQVETIKTASSINSIGACLAMVLRSNQISADPVKLSASDVTIYNELKKNLEMPLNLKGCSLDEVLYFVSGGNLVVAMKNSKDAVILTGYDENNVTYFDPKSGYIKTSVKNAADLFENTGNIYISYLK